LLWLDPTVTISALMVIQSIELDGLKKTEVTTKKYENVGYNKAELTFIEARGNDTKNIR
jgi:hypothetical protein